MTNPAGDEEFQSFLVPGDILKHQFPASHTDAGIRSRENYVTSVIAPFMSDFFAARARPPHACSAGGAVALRSGASQVVRVARERASGALLSGKVPSFPR